MTAALDPSTVPQDDTRFPNANLTGETKPTSVLLAAYFADGAPKLLRMWRNDATVPITDWVAEQVVTPEPSGYARTELHGLRPGTWYAYAYFVVEDDEVVARSLVARFRTAPGDDALEPLSIAISACNGGKVDPDEPIVPFRYPALEVTARQAYDLFLHLGDQAYMDRVFAAGGTLPMYLDGWRAYLGSEGMRQCYARAGMLATWDDHEVTDNLQFRAWTTDPEDLRKRDNALAAFYTVLPVAADGPETPLWRSFRWGRTAEIFILDCRYQRRQPSTGVYLGADQMAWLKQTLLASPCHFKIIASSAPMTDLSGVHELVRFDRWEAYEADRRALLDHINAHDITNVWFLTGDHHVNFVSRIEREGDDLASRTMEIGCTGGNERMNLYGPNILYSRARARGVVVTFDPSRDVVHARFVDPETGEDDFAEELRQGPVELPTPRRGCAPRRWFG